MKTKCPRYQLEYRLKGDVDWRPGSSFSNLKFAKECVDATLQNLEDIAEARIFDNKLQVWRYYRTNFPLKP